MRSLTVFFGKRHSAAIVAVLSLLDALSDAKWNTDLALFLSQSYLFWMRSLTNYSYWAKNPDDVAVLSLLDALSDAEESILPKT